MTDKEIARQDFVDNSIFDLIREINPTSKTVDWDIDFIGEVRDVITKHFLNLKICTEQEFYPFVNE